MREAEILRDAASKSAECLPPSSEGLFPGFEEFARPGDGFEEPAVLVDCSAAVVECESLWDGCAESDIDPPRLLVDVGRERRDRKRTADGAISRAKSASSVPALARRI